MLYEYYVSCVIWVCLEHVECCGDSVWVSVVVERNPTINHILPPVITTHYPHDIQHALNKPILHTIHNTHITLILPNL